MAEKIGPGSAGVAASGFTVSDTTSALSGAVGVCATGVAASTGAEGESISDGGRTSFCTSVEGPSGFKVIADGGDTGAADSIAEKIGTITGDGIVGSWNGAAISAAVSARAGGSPTSGIFRREGAMVGSNSSRDGRCIRFSDAALGVDSRMLVILGTTRGF